MNVTGLRQYLESLFSKAIEDSAFFDGKEWTDEGGIVGAETIALAASAAASVIVAVAEAQEYAKREGYLKET